jgi:hypothetical protein
MFELDASNTVLYSRLEMVGRGDGVPAPDHTGQSLSEVADLLLNVEDLRSRINHFRSSGAQADGFDFTYEYEEGPVPVRVLLARIREHHESRHTNSVLIHIRERH